MEHKAPYALVGLFVCMCIAGIIGFVVWSQGDSEKDYASYTLLMPDSVSGLEVGAQVLYRGIRVGKVEKMRLPPADDSNVRVDISMRSDVPVHKTTRAELARMSLTGIVNVNITAPDAGDHEPPLRMAGESKPIIQGQKSALETALKDVPVITKQLRSFTGKANESLEDFRGSFVGKIMGQQQDDKKEEKVSPRQMNLRN